LPPLYIVQQPPFKLVGVRHRRCLGGPRLPEQEQPVVREARVIGRDPCHANDRRAIPILRDPEQVEADRRVDRLAPSEPAVPEREDLELHPSPRAMAVSTANARFQPPPSMARWQTTHSVTRFWRVSAPSWERGRM